MPTYSGSRRLVHGTRERILSSDHNREQAFEAAMIADALRYLYDADTSEEQAAGVATIGSTLTSPLRAVVFNGLRVRPEIGTFNIFVDAGMGLFVDPTNATSDDSAAQLIRSAGQSVAGALTISTPGGGARIDVIECSVSQVVIEADSRDVFNPSTGTFSPQLINKVVEAQLTFRVRAGTPGGGFPGTASGWLPLAVAKVPSAAVSCDDCTFWDVRPLMSDFARSSHVVRGSFPRYERQMASAIEEGAGNWRARGVVETELAGRKVGGNLASTSSGLTYVDLTVGGVVQEPGFVAVASRPWILYGALPFGLPRWVQYSPASSGARVPTGPRGILIFSQKLPAGLAGTPSSALVLPTDTALGGTTSAAVPLLSGAFGAGAVFCGSVTDDRMTHILTPGISIAPVTPGSAADYNLTTTVIPPNATAVRLRFTALIDDNPGSSTISRAVALYDAPGGNIVVELRNQNTVTIPASGSFIDIHEVEVPLPPNLPSGAGTTRRVRLTTTMVSGGALSFSNQDLKIVGWKLG